MRSLLALVVVLHSACILAPEDGRETGSSGLRNKVLTFKVDLTPNAPMQVIRFPAKAPRSTAQVTFELSSQDQARLADVCAIALASNFGRPETPPACQLLDPETGRRLGRDYVDTTSHAWNAATAAWVGAEYAVDKGGSFAFQRAAVWLFKDGQPARFENMWWAPAVGQGESFAFRIVRAEELPADLFPHLRFTVRVEVSESDPANKCFGEPDGRSVCCASDIEICTCQGGQEVKIDECGTAVLSGAALADEISSHGATSAREQVYCGMVEGEGITVPYPRCNFSLD